MSDLASQQTAFLTAVTRAEAVSFTSQPHRLEIYHNNWSGVILNALRLTYPVVEKLVGTPFFTGLAREYRKAFLPASANLDDYGKSLAEFMENFPPARPLPYLPDVARLEWLYHESAFAAAAPALALSDLAAIAPESYGNLRLTPHPSCRLLLSPHPVDRIWRMNQENADPAETLHLKEAGEARLLVARAAHETHIHALSPGEYRFLSALCDNAPLFEAFEAAHAPESGFDLAKSLQRLVANGAFSGYSLTNEGNMHGAH